jgi:MFS transporter, UMF1 family
VLIASLKPKSLRPLTRVGSFLPVTLEQLARERGVLWSNKITPCIAKAASNDGKSRVASAASLLMRATEQKDNGQCVIRIFGTEVTTASFAMYTFSVAVFVQALVLVSFSSVADHGEVASLIAHSDN